MSINKFRGLLYTLAKLLGDVQAVRSPRKGAITRRIGRRLAGKATGRMLGKLFR
ncbi:hypothetical protein [Paracoccus aestuarii]|uniref:hypothetical protein n=1 Tax=Paracoccus aestuarii TaxID=453842 RepID=UPI0014734039|nr:hypothetical protein [Paracoccus aestuarii]WCQ99116.1 hypothetical protein JHW48_14970 [Paracoccus aestuarii]